VQHLSSKMVQMAAYETLLGRLAVRKGKTIYRFVKA